MLISQSVQGLGTAIPLLVELAGNLIIALVDGLASQLPTILTQLATILSSIALSLLSTINTCLPRLLQAGIQIIIALLQGLTAGLPQIVQSAMQIINYFVMCLLQNLPILLSAGFQLLWALVNGIMNNLGTISSAALTLIGQLVSGLLQNAPLFISCAIQLIVALVAGLNQAIPQLEAAIPQIISAIINAFSTTDWGSIGESIITGIQDGLNAVKESLLDTARSIWNSLKSIFSKKVEANVSVKGGGGGDTGGSKPAKHAAGGIFNQATLLPSVNGANHIVGEAGPEAILPLQSLWNNLSSTLTPGFTTLNDKLNVLANKLLTNGSANSSGSGGAVDGGQQPIIFSPQITIQGNASKEDVEDALTMSQQQFEQMYNRMMKQKQRVAF